jgi:hypothetical protein
MVIYKKIGPSRFEEWKDFMSTGRMSHDGLIRLANSEQESNLRSIRIVKHESDYLTL